MGRTFARGDADWRQPLGPAEREHTPPEMAKWLVALAAKCKAPNSEITGRP